MLSRLLHSGEPGDRLSLPGLMGASSRAGLGLSAGRAFLREGDDDETACSDLWSRRTVTAARKVRADAGRDGACCRRYELRRVASVFSAGTSCRRSGGISVGSSTRSHAICRGAFRLVTGEHGSQAFLSGAARTRQRRWGPFQLRDDSERSLSRHGLSALRARFVGGLSTVRSGPVSRETRRVYDGGSKNLSIRMRRFLRRPSPFGTLIRRVGGFDPLARISAALPSGPAWLLFEKVSLRSPSGWSACSSPLRPGRIGSGSLALRLPPVPGRIW